MIRRPRALFFGTPDFAVPILHATAAIADIVAVVTQPDQPKGRGQKSAHSAVFSAAESLHIPILTPTRFDDATTKALTALAPDIAVLAAYGNIIPQHVLDIPRKGFINIHPSLLPKYRGAAPIAGAILNDDETTGTTLIVLDDEMDHGPIIAQETLAIEPHEHRPSLEKRCAELGAKLISSALVPYLEGSIEPKAQVHHLAIYTRQLARENAHINWTDDAARIERDVRAFDPWPGTVTTWEGATLKIIDGHAERYRTSPRGKIGEVIMHDEQPAVVCGVDMLVLTNVQPANGKPMDAAAFARGHRTFVGNVLT